MHTHIYKHMCTKLLRDTRLEARVTHANETGPGSSRQRSVILHSGASVQKLKSFSPPSPVIVTPTERRSGNHLFSHTVRRTHKPYYICMYFLILKKPSQTPILYLVRDICNERETHLQGHIVLFNPEMSDPTEMLQGCKLHGCNCEISSLSFRSMSQL